jgi:O-antigen/teichoic acid export membrane protein
MRPTLRSEGLRPERLIRASILYGLSGVLGKAGALVTVPIVTRALGPADYGLLDLSVTLIGLATIVGGFSAELPAARLVARAPESRKPLLTTYAATVVALTFGIALLIAAANQVIAQDIWMRDDAQPIVLVAAGAVALTGIQLATWHIHRINDRPVAYASLSVIDIALKVCLIWAAAVAGLGTVGIVFVYFGVAALGAIVGLWTARMDLALSAMPSVVPILLRGGALFTVIGVAFVASNYVVRALIAGDGGGAAVGAMGVAVRVASLLALPLRAFHLAWAPGSMAASQSTSSQVAFRQSIIAVLIVGALAAATLGAFGPEVVLLFAGADYLTAAGAVPGLAMATTLGAVFFMIGVACSVAGIPVWIAGLAAVTGAAVQIVVTAILLGPVGTQSAIGLGAVVGQATAIGWMVQASASRALPKSWPILAITMGTILIVISLQLVLDPGLIAARWTLGAGAASLLIVVSRRSYVARARQ